VVCLNVIPEDLMVILIVIIHLMLIAVVEQVQEQVHIVAELLDVTPLHFYTVIVM
jgi:hypothetical protein